MPADDSHNRRRLCLDVHRLIRYVPHREDIENQRNGTSKLTSVRVEPLQMMWRLFKGITSRGGGYGYCMLRVGLKQAHVAERRRRCAAFRCVCVCVCDESRDGHTHRTVSHTLLYCECAVRVKLFGPAAGALPNPG